jgi:Polysulphide reductase, NrfD
VNLQEAEPHSRSYYGRPIIKAPIWEPAIPWYFFLGGLAGASATLGLGARVTGNERLARNATFAGAAAVGVSPILLTADLGRPERFYNMFRVVKITSPMSVGTWILGASGTALGIAGGCEALGIFPRVKLAAQTAAGLLGLPLTTYTAALVANTAVPVWHEARRELPFVFAGSAAASAGAAAALATPPAQAGAARRLAVSGALLELGATKAMEMRLGQLLGEPYRQGTAGRFTRLAKGCSVAGAALVALGGRRRARRSAAGCSLRGRCSSAWPSTELALSRPPTRSTRLRHNETASRASALKRRRFLPGAERTALSAPGEVEGHDKGAIGPDHSAPSGRDVLAGERAIAAMMTAPPMLASSIGRRLSASGSIAHERITTAGIRKPATWPADASPISAASLSSPRGARSTALPCSGDVPDQSDDHDRNEELRQVCLLRELFEGADERLGNERRGDCRRTEYPKRVPQRPRPGQRCHGS